MTLPEFCVKLGLSRHTALRLIEKRIVRAIQLGEKHRILIHRGEIARLAKEYQR